MGTIPSTEVCEKKTKLVKSQNVDERLFLKSNNKLLKDVLIGLMFLDCMQVTLKKLFIWALRKHKVNKNEDKTHILPFKQEARAEKPGMGRTWNSDPQLEH